MTTQQHSARQSPIIKASPSSDPARPKNLVMEDVRPALTPESLDGIPSTNSAAASSEIPIRSTPKPEADALHIIAKHSKLLVSAIDELQAFGIDSVVALPKVVVVGDQSSGKSSLIEALSGITVPRDAGCCTRCPLQIILKDDNSDSAQWTCVVNLVKKFACSPDLEPEHNPLYPWIENGSPSSFHFATVHSKDELEGTIRRAQVATLNPHQSPHRYMSPDCTDNSINVQFSPNVVSLEISAPGLPGLSFYDLPGVISQSRDGKTETINLVRELVRYYVGQENTLVLLAVPFESDIDNSKASGLLNELNANNRTIGVLTKPDRLQSDDRVEGWLEVLRGEAFAKGHGYYVVKQPSQQDLNSGITHAEARQKESEFFESEGWKNRFAGFQDRLGTGRLRDVLSGKLAALSLDCLPSVAQRVEIRLRELNDELKRLPDPPANAFHVVTTAVSDFANQMRIKLDSERPNNLTKSWKEARNVFKNAIQVEGCPTLVVNEAAYLNTAKLNGANITPKSIKKQQVFTTPSKRERETETIDLDDSDDEPVPQTPSKRAKTTTVLQRRHAPLPARSSRVQYRLDQIRQTLEDYTPSYTPSNIPNAIDLKALEKLMMDSLVNWGSPLGTVFKALRKALDVLVKTTLNETESAVAWKTTSLYKELDRITRDLINNHVRDLETGFATQALEFEQEKMMTNDADTFNRHQNEELAYYQANRFRERSEAYFDEQEVQTNKPIAQTARDQKRLNLKEAETIHKAIGEDPFAREVIVMSNVKAYYHIAATRFVDNILLGVEAGLFRNLKKKLFEELEKGLRVRHADALVYAGKLLDDDPVRAERRQKLKEEKKGLDKATARIEEINREIYTLFSA